MKSIIGFFLIFVFLGLGSCPVKKAFHAFLENSLEKELDHQNGDGKAKNFISATCDCTDNHITQKLILPERSFTLSVSHIQALFLTTFLRFDLPSLERPYELKYDQELSYIYHDAVPVYLWNRSLLI